MLPKGPNLTPKHLYNPDTKDFTVTYANDENVPIPYILHAEEIGTFPTYIANHIAKHLAHYLVSKRDIKTNYEDEYQAVLKEIEVEL